VQEMCVLASMCYTHILLITLIVTHIVYLTVCMVNYLPVRLVSVFTSANEVGKVIYSILFVYL